MGTMTNWADFWLKTARRCFPDLPLYLVTGGDGAPRLGADFTAQARLAAHYRAGIRITNLSDDYLSSFVVTRLMSSACRFYAADYSTEEAAINSEAGVVMRIFDAAASGAVGIYFKRLIGLGYDQYTRTFVPAGRPASAAVQFGENLRYLQRRRPVIDLAVFYPAGAIKIKPARQQALFHFWMRLRTALDFDLINERMISDGVLAAYRFFILDDNFLESDAVCHTLRHWIQAGGILLVTQEASRAGPLFEPQPPGVVMELSGLKIYQSGSGYAGVLKKGVNKTACLSEACFNRNGKFPWPPIQYPVVKRKGMFYARVGEDWLVYDSRKHLIRLENDR
jgi:hypothetical protein